MANYKIEVDKAAIEDFLDNNPKLRDYMIAQGHKVAARAQATASDAEGGPGGTIDGYASAGFEVQYERRGGRPRVNIISKADGATALAAHFNTQRKNGVGHLRAALYAFTRRGA